MPGLDSLAGTSRRSAISALRAVTFLIGEYFYRHSILVL
jgi:hypothetical protein